MNNKVETLRAICYTASDMETITNLGDSFSELEIDFMVQFKMIYELGLDQLEIFINKLDEEGEDLDTYTIEYYVTSLLNGPLGLQTRELAKDKKYFLVGHEDSIGTLGNVTRSAQNNTLYETIGYPLGSSVDTYNKLPNFAQTTLTDSIKLTEDIFRGSLKSSSEVDNTLPIVDKLPQLRYEEEPVGKLVLRPNAAYMAKDVFFYLSVKDVSQDVFEKIKETLGDEDYRIYKDKKQYSPFDSEKNTSTSTNSKIKKKFTDGDLEEVIILDLLGDEFDSVERRTSKLIVSSDVKDKEYLLHTNEGQLGS